WGPESQSRRSQPGGGQKGIGRSAPSGRPCVCRFEVARRRRQTRRALKEGIPLAAVTADQLYQMIKEWEGTFPLPAPYVTVDVGTFDAATGAFQGLKTEVETDPEPIEHGA